MFCFSFLSLHNKLPQNFGLKKQPLYHFPWFYGLAGLGWLVLLLCGVTAEIAVTYSAPWAGTSQTASLVVAVSAVHLYRELQFTTHPSMHGGLVLAYQLGLKRQEIEAFSPLKVWPQDFQNITELHPVGQGQSQSQPKLKELGRDSTSWHQEWPVPAGRSLAIGDFGDYSLLSQFYICVSTTSLPSCMHIVTFQCQM